MPEHHKNVELKEISQKVYRSEYIDGILFILLGFMLLIAAGIINLHPFSTNNIHLGSFDLFPNVPNHNVNL